MVSLPVFRYFGVPNDALGSLQIFWGVTHGDLNVVLEIKNIYFRLETGE